MVIPKINIFLSLFILLSALQLFLGACASDKPSGGSWSIPGEKLSGRRCSAHAELLPDGNALICGGCGMFTKENSAEIFSPEKQKIIKIINISDTPVFAVSDCSTAHLNDGNILLAYKVKYSGKKTKSVFEAKIFDSALYEFKDIKFSEKINAAALFIPLDGGNILIVNSSDGADYIYDAEKQKLSRIKTGSGSYKPVNFFHKNPDGSIIFFRSNAFNKYKTYIYSDGEIEQAAENLPLGAVQLDENSYFYADVKYDYFTGYVYNIKENKKKAVSNKIEAYASYPVYVKLSSSKVLIFGINEKNQSKDEIKEYASYIYDRKKNMFYKISNPPVRINRHTAAVMLKDGSILFAGGNLGLRPAIYKY